MKTLKKILIVILILIVIPLIVALFVPKKYKSSGEIVINKPQKEVFEYIRYVKNQDNFGVWQLSDLNMTKTAEGTDGTVGFRYSWDSETLGKGAQVITRIVENERMESDLFFYDFGDEPNKSYITVGEKSPNETLVKWGISGKSPYPFNLMNLFMNMDKDFDKGLRNLKEIVEKQPSPTAAARKRVQFKTEIKAPAEKVYRTMLGLDDKTTYEHWTSLFHPGSTFEGTWEKGSKILFIGTDENGKKGGMIAEIVENNPNKFVSIRSTGILDGDKEITSGEQVEQWTGGLENYTFEENNGITILTVDIDVVESYADYFNQNYPKALQKLKEVCEK